MANNSRHKLTAITDRSARLLLMAGLVLFFATLTPLAAQQGHQQGHQQEGAEKATEQVTEQATEESPDQGCCAGCKDGKMKGEGMQCGDMKGEGMKGEGHHGAAMSGMKGKGHGGGERGMGGKKNLMGNIHGLIDSHTKITREVKKIDDGIISVTRTDDPALVETLQTHVAEMYDLIENDGSIRHWDPLFVEIFKHSDKIMMEMDLLDDGIRVRETSKDPYVVKLIQAHADKIDEFVARGMDAMHEPTAVPDN